MDERDGREDGKLILRDEMGVDCDFSVVWEFDGIYHAIRSTVMQL